MRILFCQKIEGISGSEAYYINLLPELVKKGIHCTFLSVTPISKRKNIESFINILESNAIKTICITISKNISFRLLKQLNEVLDEENYDFVQTNLIHADVWFVLIKLLYKPKLIILSTYHSFDSNDYQQKFGFEVKSYKNLFYYCSMFSQKFITHTLVISDGLKNLMLNKGLTRVDRISRIHYGFNLPNKNPCKNDFPFRKSSNQLLMIGRLIEIKGHKHILSILNELINVYPDLSLVIVGTGNYEIQLRESVSKMNLENHVYFEGHRNNIHDYIFNSDLCLMLSRAEGFGVVILECFKYGCPVLAWDLPAMNELIDHNETGLLVEAFKLDKLRDEIIQFLNNKSQQSSRINKNSHNKLTEYFNLKRMTDESIDLYKSLIIDSKDKA